MAETELGMPLRHLLSQICRLYHDRAREAVHNLGLYRGQPPMLFILWHQDGRTHSNLARWLDVSPATVTKMVQRMEKAGFVERRADPDDQRVSRVYLTANGGAIREQVEEIFLQLEADVFSGFTESERDICRGLMVRMIDNLGGDPHRMLVPPEADEKGKKIKN